MADKMVSVCVIPTQTYPCC